MDNAVSILISNNTGIRDAELYVFITDEDNNFYKIEEAGNWMATRHTEVCPALLSELPQHSDGVYKFYISANTNMDGGRIWFSTSITALRLNQQGKIIQPSIYDSFEFDFVEISTNAPTRSTPGHATTGVTQADGLGIPITLFVNPAENAMPFPPPRPAYAAVEYNYPNVIGIEPWQALNMIINKFKCNIKNTPYAPFGACAASVCKVKRLVAPFHFIDNYTENTPATELATFLDQAIFHFFRHYITHTLTLQDSLSQDQYKGTVTTVTETDIHGKPAIYNVLQFTGPRGVFNIYFPFFNTNCSAFPGTLNLGVTLAAPPHWWADSLPQAMPATAMVFGCSGVFADAYQQNVPSPTLLRNLQKQVASLIARGQTPANNHGSQGMETVNPFPASRAAEMDAVQPVQLMGRMQASAEESQWPHAGIANTRMQVNTGWLTCGSVYPETINAAGYSNAYANFLHNGTGIGNPPLLNGLGHAFAYDDHNGFNDITVNYDKNNALTLGIFLGPMYEEMVS